jgi:hypothetical protein
METGDIYDDFALERLAKEQFGLVFEIDKVIVRNVDAGKGAKATVLLTTKKQLYCYMYGPAKLLLSDVKKAASRMGFSVELYFPPKGRPHYFDEIGKQKFKEVFPGRNTSSDEDILFYRTLAPYNPALLLIHEVKDGIIYQADSDARGGWRQAAKFTYRRIKTS